MNILIIGGGKMGMSHLAIITQYIGKTSISVCDTNFFRRLFFRLLGYKAFGNHVCAKNKLGSVHGVLIATPTKSHEELVQWAINENIPCFVEKPLTLDYKKSFELLKFASKNNAYVQLGFVMRYVRSFQKLFELINENKLGSVRFYEASMNGNVITKDLSKESWQGIYEQGGGCLNEYGPHLIDLCVFIFGKVENVDSASMDKVFSQRADDLVEFTLTHDSGLKGKVNLNWVDHTKRKSVIQIIVHFDNFILRVDNSTIESQILNDKSHVHTLLQKTDLSVVPQNVSFYLRGEEFSLEIEPFLNICSGQSARKVGSKIHDITPLISSGVDVDRIIDEVAKNVGLK